MVKYDRIAFFNANALTITKAFVQCIYALDKTMNQHVRAFSSALSKKMPF